MSREETKLAPQNQGFSLTISFTVQKFCNLFFKVNLASPLGRLPVLRTKRRWGGVECKGGGDIPPLHLVDAAGL